MQFNRWSSLEILCVAFFCSYRNSSWNRCFISRVITGLRISRLFIVPSACALRCMNEIYNAVVFIYVVVVYSFLDLVAISSTVIPLYTHQVNSTDETKYHPLSLDEEEYRIAYMKLLMHKKHTEAPEDPDTLITCKEFINRCLFTSLVAKNSCWFFPRFFLQWQKNIIPTKRANWSWPI